MLIQRGHVPQCLTINNSQIMERYTHTHTHTHTHTLEYYSEMKKNEILPFATMWKELDGIMLSKIVRERQIYDLTPLWNLRYKTDEHKGKQK